MNTSLTISYVKAEDPVHDSPALQIDIHDPSGITRTLQIPAASITDEKERTAIELFAYAVEAERRKAQYLEKYPLSDGQHNYERVILELNEDFFDHHFRRRGDKQRLEGLSKEVVSEYHRHK